MTADRAKKLVKDNFPCIMDNPFSDLSATVFRHSDSRKWFGLIMEVASSKFGLFPERKLEVINLKCDPLEPRDKIAVFPAYHMNKKHWISVVLENISAKRLLFLMEISFELTKK